MTAAEWELFTRIVSDYQSDLPQPDIVVHLTASPIVQMKRIATRGRSFESGYTLEYLQSITDRLTEYATSLTTLKDIVYLPFDTEQFDLGMPANQQKLLSLLKPTLN